MRPQLVMRRHLSAGLAAATLLLTACGGSDTDTESAPAAQTEAPDDNAQVAASPPPEGAALVDLIGVEVTAAADVEANQLPDVVVDDLTTGRKVNFRNLAPQDKPILLWMWAPH